MPTEEEAAVIDGPMTVDEGAASLLIQSEPEPVQRDEPTGDDEGQQEAPEDQLEETGEADDASDDAEGNQDPVEDDQDESDGEGEDQQEEEPESFTYRADGKEHKASLDELLQLASAGHGFNSKFEKLAQERRELQTQRETIENQLRQEYLGRLREIENGLGVMQEPDWQSIAQQSPDEYVRMRAQWDDLTKRRQEVQEQRATEEQAMLERQQSQAQEYVTQQREILLQQIPEWQDDQVYKAESKELAANAIEFYGFNQDEVANVTDSRIVRLLRDAASWRKHQSKKTEVTRAAKRAPKAQKPSAAKAKIDPKKAASRDAMNRLRTAENRTDAVNAATDFLLTG